MIKRLTVSPRLSRAAFWSALVLAAASTALQPTGVEAAPSVPISTLPSLGDAAAEDLSVGAERRLGERIMQEIRRDPDVLDDPLLFDYVQSLWTRLVAAARARGELSSDQDAHFAFEPFLVRDRSVNAFALPGGFIGIHLGLISITATGDELAAVLAHELSHVTQRHIARSMASSKRNTMLGMTAMILGVLAASRSNGVSAANAAIVGGQAAMVQSQLNFSRDMEREADRVGFGVLDQAGFAPAGMMSMFDKLQTASRLNDSQQFPYLRSHPLTSERIGEARSRLGTASGPTPDATGPARWEHAFMQGRARALMDMRAVSQQRLSQALSTDAAAALIVSPEQVTVAVAAAVAASNQRDWASADRAMASLRSAAAAQPDLVRWVNALQVEQLVERGRGVQAQQLLAQSPDGSRFSQLLAARASIQSGQGVAASAESLQTWVTTHPKDSTAWQVLGQVQDKLGLKLAALRSSAESRLALGDLPGAIDRLRAGQREARVGRSDNVDSAIIEARLRQLEARRRQIQLDERDRRRDDEP